MQRPIYLDHNATAPVKPAVIEAMAAALAECGNPSSVHRFGRLARRRLEEARERVAQLAGAAAAEVVFTSGGSEANALALAAAAGRPILLGATEHPSLLDGVPAAPRIPVDATGVIRETTLAELLADRPRAFVSVQLANNETGVLQPIARIAELVHGAGGMLHVDGAQAPGRILLDMAALGADLLTLSAHKMGGPQGVGALLVRPGIAPMPLIRGGGQERGWRSGTENLSGIVGFGVAAELAIDDLARAPQLAAMRDRLEERLLRFAPEARIHGQGAARLPNTCCIGLPGLPSETQVMALDLEGFAVSAGSACSSGKVRRSAVLEAMGVPVEEAGFAIRVSIGWSTAAEHLERFVEAWCALHARTRARRTADRASA